VDLHGLKDLEGLKFPSKALKNEEHNFTLPIFYKFGIKILFSFYCVARY